MHSIVVISPVYGQIHESFRNNLVANNPLPAFGIVDFFDLTPYFFTMYPTQRGSKTDPVLADVPVSSHVSTSPTNDGARPITGLKR